MKTHKIQSENLNISVINNGTLTKRQQQPFVMLCTMRELKNLCLNFSDRLEDYIGIAQIAGGYSHLIPLFDDAQQLLGDYAEKIKAGQLITTRDRNVIRREIKECLKAGAPFAF